MKKFITLTLCVLLCAVAFAGCADQPAVPTTTAPPEAPAETAPPPEPQPEPEPQPQEYTDPLPETIPGTIYLEDGGVMRFELYPHIAPQSVFNFIYLARQGFYDGLGFHRILENFMAQGGCPQGTGGGNPGYAIFGEFSDNGFENNLLHTRGVLSMARATDYNSAGSQFFIMFGTSAFLDGGYAAFGLITEGLDVVDSLEATPNAGRAGNGFVEPEDRPIIRTITIDSDVVVPLPDKLPRP